MKNALNVSGDAARKGEVAIDDESVIVSRRDVSSLYSSRSRLLSLSLSSLCVRMYDAEGERPFIILKAPALISPVALQPSNQSTKATRNNPPHLSPPAPLWMATL
jgi:hypothetical protein